MNKRLLKDIFLLPCIPYHLSVFIWINYLAFRDNDFQKMLMTRDIKRNEKFDEFIDRFDKETMPIQIIYCCVIWGWLLFITFKD